MRPLLVCSILWLASCESETVTRAATQALVELKTDLGSELRKVDVTVADARGAETGDSTSFDGAGVSFGVAPQDGVTEGIFTLIATGYTAGETPRITVRRKGEFREGRTQHYALWLRRVCLDVQCDASLTCLDDGRCGAVPFADASEGPDDDAGTVPPDAGPAPSPGEIDASVAGNSGSAAGAGGMVAPSPCERPTAECKVGAIEERTAKCGFCETGVRTSTRTCSASCSWGRWIESDECRGVTGECEPMDTRSSTRTCGNCGVEPTVRTCSNACLWSEPEVAGACSETAGSCTPGMMRTLRSEPCGNCNTGSLAVTQKCDDACMWGPEIKGTCSGASTECKVGDAPIVETLNCQGCGTRTRTRTCDPATCKLVVSNESACGWCEECAVVVYCDTPDEVAPNRGTWCRRGTANCSMVQAEADCREDVAGESCPWLPPIYWD